MTEISTTARRQNHATEIVSTSVESIEVGEKEKTLPETEVSAFPEKVSPEKLSEIVPEESTEVSISTESPVSDLPKNQMSELLRRIGLMIQSIKSCDKIFLRSQNTTRSDLILVLSH